MPAARPRRRGQAPQPWNGAAKPQGLTATIAVAAPSSLPSIATHDAIGRSCTFDSTDADASMATSVTQGIYTNLTDATEILLSEGFPDDPADEKAVWHSRYRSIAALERHLYDNGTRIIKFYLHLSKEEQRKRFLERIDEPEKNWKLSLADIEERKFWEDYREAYEKCLSATSTSHAPWYVVPADDKKNARMIVSQIVLDALAGLKITYPETSPDRRRELASIRKRLLNEDPSPLAQKGE
jgi:hypothetical protein